MNHTKLRFDPLRLLAVVIFLWASADMASAAAAKYQVIHPFQGGSDGAYPFAGLVADKDGNLYGTTYRGGRESGMCQADDGCGTVFQLKPPATRGGTWTESVIYKFGPFAHPAASLIIDQAGNLYGTTPYAGKSDNGTVFELQRPAAPGGAWTERTLHSFAGGNDGSTPVSNLVFDQVGNMYGTTQFGGGGPCMVFQQGSGCGTAFQLTPPTKPGGAWKESVLYRFIPANDYPLAGLIFDSQGNLYGTTAGDQSASFGTVFELAPPAKRGGSWKQATLYSFGSVKNDGSTPGGGLIFDEKGNLYGTTSAGGSEDATQCLGLPSVGHGTVFELERPASPGAVWNEKVLYAFNHGSDGACPLAALVADSAGKLYGTAAEGGSEFGVCAEIGGCGTLFQLKPSAGGGWTEVTLHEFEAGVDGLEPLSTLIFGKGGRLFGTTAGGGGTCAFPIPCGTVFSRVP
jgi:hypothetical protein